MHFLPKVRPDTHSMLASKNFKSELNNVLGENLFAKRARSEAPRAWHRSSEGHSASLVALSRQLCGSTCNKRPNSGFLKN